MATVAFVLSLLLASAVIFIIAAGSAPLPAPGNCSEVYTSFFPCLGYVSVAENNLTAAVESWCCHSLASAIDSDTEMCFCHIFKYHTFVGVELNQSRLVSLPTVCSLRNSNLTVDRLNSFCSPANLPGFGKEAPIIVYHPIFDPSNPVLRNFTRSTHLPPAPAPAPTLQN